MLTPKKVEIKEECYSLDCQDQIRMVCPFCKGGSDGEKSLSATMTPLGILYKCFRDKCQSKGFISTSPREVVEGERSRKSSKIKPFRKQTRVLKEEEAGLFWDKFGLMKEEIGRACWSCCLEDNRIVQPIFNIHGGIIGHNTRAYPEFFGEPINKKAIAYYENTNCPKASFHKGDRETQRIVLVEDIVSAIKVEGSTGLTSVALLGTEVGRDLEQELLENGFKRLTICLDPDAQRTAIELARRLSLNFAAEVMPLPEDPKDCGRVTLHSYLIGGEQ